MISRDKFNVYNHFSAIGDFSHHLQEFNHLSSFDAFYGQWVMREEYLLQPNLPVMEYTDS